MRVTSAQGSQLNVQIGGGTVKVGRATVTAADVACSNGVIHVIDKVLLAPLAEKAAPFDPAQQIGAMAPLGFFDPLGFSKKGDKAGFNNLQAAEIKHGRVAMMAALGAVVQHYVKFPGFESVPTGLGAVTTAPGKEGFAALFLVSGVLELAIWTQDDKKEPGNFGDPAGLNMYNPEMREKEINNGRMGMFSAIGIIAAEALSGKDGMNQLGSALASAANSVLPAAAVADASAPSSVNLVGLAAVGATLAAAASTRRRTQKVSRNFFGGDSTPARPSFEVSQQSGIQEPIGFFDPLGLSADNDEATFKRRRTVEIKHGRVAMFVPLLGWFQILWFAGLIEGSGFFSGKYGLGFMKDTTMEGEPGNYGAGFPTFLGKVEDPEARKTKLAAELANGRLAMMAIIGMFFQDGLTGSAWGDWSLYTASPLRAAGSFAGYQAPQAEKSGRAAVVARRAENIAATAIANGNFTILVKALQKAGLVETVSGKTPYTVFAPTDAAFADLLKELKSKRVPDPNILLYHVAGGTTMSSSLKDGMRVTSAQGAQLNVQIGGGTVKVGRATVTAADVACSNGVIHVIDKVLLPPAKPAEAFDPAQQIGAMAPLGFFDPLGFSKKGDKAGFNNLQASEIKHGRVAGTLIEEEEVTEMQQHNDRYNSDRAMMAALGAVVQHYVKFPGFESVPTGLGAVTTAPGTYGFAALFLVSGVLELAIWTQDDKKEPGNFGDPAGLNMYNPEMRQKEINNGRMGMFSAIGIIGAEVLSGKDGMNQLGSALASAATGVLPPSAVADASAPSSVNLVGLAAVGATLAAAASTRRRTQKVTRNFFGGDGTPARPSFEVSNQSGIQEPIGFFDPLGLSADNDEVPLLGWFQILWFAGLIEGSGFFSGKYGLGFMKDTTMEGEPGNYGAGFPTFLGKVEDPEARKTKLAAELANGRLAMMAIIGMFFQDGLTGSAWGDWSLYTASPLRAAGSFAGYQAPQAEKSGRAAVVARRAENIAATAIANGNFTILVKALEKAGLVETVSGKTPYTVFAPTDAAFADLLKELKSKLKCTPEQLLANPDLKNILLYHVAGGTTMSSSLKDGMRVTSAQGAQLNVQIGGGTVKVGRATVTAADVACSNGVIHVIDKVLLPPAKPAEAFDPAQQIGAMAPLGFFDPLGFSKKGDKAGFNNLQASEIKHGRVAGTLIEEEEVTEKKKHPVRPAMMAALGAVVQHYVKFPGFESVPTGLGAVTTAPGTYGFAALFLVSGVLELAIWTQDDKKEPGNFGDPAGLNMYNPEMRQKEINNGRMGMFSAIGIIGAEVLSGKDGMNQLGF
ncbi:unnamed protein product [Polarella glacialis]|uniref:FAS1 domain-containing protein n=1 Tax=Polarella glacialis TaxID=89957 RepID=A0A813L6H4_POLGL|nr:unnamed protein product [Polarella glacialis]